MQVLGSGYKEILKIFCYNHLVCVEENNNQSLLCWAHQLYINVYHQLDTASNIEPSVEEQVFSDQNYRGGCEPSS